MDTIKGTVYRKDPPVKYSEKFTSQNIVVQEDQVTKNGAYTSFYQIQAANDKMSLLNNVQVGMEVTCTVGIRGTKYNRKDNGQEGFMVSLNLIKIEAGNTFTQQGRPVNDEIMASDLDAGGVISSYSNNTLKPQSDDLPF